MNNSKICRPVHQSLKVEGDKSDYRTTVKKGISNTRQRIWKISAIFKAGVVKGKIERRKEAVGETWY